MIISKTPLRLSFTGGGSDMAVFYKRRTGAVISTSINKYIFVNINKKFDEGIRLAYSINEEVKTVQELKHPIVKAVLEYGQCLTGIEITTIADIPSKGTGLGSSSAFTVGLLHAMQAYLGQYMTRSQLAEIASFIEIEKLSEPIGKQDQYASAFGGLNYIEFYSDDSVSVEPITIDPTLKQQLNKNCLFFYTGITRSASNILAGQQQSVANDLQKFDALCNMVDLTKNLKKSLNTGKIDDFGAILHENWLLKKSLNQHISNEFIDEIYETALKNGALGGKLLGAGAGGFLLFYVPEQHHATIINSIKQCRHVHFQFTNQPSQIVFYDK